MTITLDQIKAIRNKTGVSITACKKALEEANGDEAKAIEILRKKGEAKAAERLDRTTSQGSIAIKKTNGKAAILAIGCETDFVSKNEDFIAKVEDLTSKILLEGESADVNDAIADLNIQMGEKIEVADKRLMEAPVIGDYLHQNKRIGVLVALSGGDEALARDVAMHIAAMNPLYVSPSEVASELVEKEKVIWIDQLKQEGKPEQIMEKIMQGKEEKFRNECALVSQNFVKNPEMKISDLLKDVQVIEFLRCEV